MFHGLASDSPVRFYTFTFPEFCHVGSLRDDPLSPSEYCSLLERVGGHSGAVNWLTVSLLLSLVLPCSMEWQSSLSKDFLMQHVALVWFLGLANSLWAGKKESELFPEVKLRAGTSLWWLHHRTETWNFSFIGHCKSVTSLPSSQILLGTLFHEISCPFSANGACGVTFLDLSVALGDLSSRGLKTPFPRPLAAGFLSHLC